VSETELTDAQRAEAWVKLATALMYAGAMVWLVIPEHRRQLLIMRVILAARSLAHRVALRAGEASMAMELRTGRERYEMPYLLSVARDRLAAAYDRARGM
jgi:hypothetical protein